MIKLTYLVKRRPDLSREAFCARWRELHARLVADFACTLNAQRYVMTCRLDTVCNAALADSRKLSPARFDGVIEIWWQSLDEYQDGVGSSAGLKAVDAIIDAERRFVDFARSQAFFGAESVVFEQNSERPPAVDLKDSKEMLLDITRHSLVNI